MRETTPTETYEVENELNPSVPKWVHLPNVFGLLTWHILFCDTVLCTSEAVDIEHEEVCADDPPMSQDHCLACLELRKKKLET